ncbi:MAG: rhomboid family intramembrane serine protease [Bryobacterales bacterium]|nr:rhomboid family intramembrane serine protease [Bryobacterales bacterium]
MIDARTDHCAHCGIAVGAGGFRIAKQSSISAWLFPGGKLAVGLILIANVLLFAVSTATRSNTLMQYGDKWLPAILGGDWFRLLTAGYLHQGLSFSGRGPAWMPLLQFLHIFLNMAGLRNVGTIVEEIFGTRRMFAAYSAATLAGFTLSAMWAPRQQSLGASAGVFGLLGALIAYGVLSKSTAARHLQVVCLFNAGIGLIMGGFLPMIDNAAHLGGLIGGFAVAWMAGLPRWVDDTTEKLWGLVSLVSLLLTLLAFGELFYRIFARRAG